MANFDRKEKRDYKRWFLDLGHTSNSSAVARVQELPAPHSYVKHAAVEVSRRDQNVDKDLIVKRSWDIALAPVKQVPMNLFVMWMAGNSISLFPIMMIGMMAVRPVQALIASSQTFKMIEGEQAPLQKLAFIFGNLLTLAMAAYKFNSMGLLPTHASDWLTFADPPQRLEYVAGGLSLQ